MSVGDTHGSATENAGTSTGPVPLWLKITGGEIVTSEGVLPGRWMSSDQVEAGIVIRLDAHDRQLLAPVDILTLQDELVLRDGFMFLVANVTSEEVHVRSVNSFACAATLFRRFLVTRFAGLEIPYVDENLPRVLDVSAFDIGDWMLEKVRPVPALQVRRIPFFGPDKTVAAGANVSTSADWIIWHSGDAEAIRGTLSAIQAQARSVDRVYVALDGPCDARHLSLVRDHTAFRFFEMSPAGYGAAVVLDKLCRSGFSDYLLMQATDSVPCVNRRGLLTSELAAGCDIVAAHELRLDPHIKSVMRVRCSPRTTLALHSEGHSVGMLGYAMTRSAFVRAGGFSSARPLVHEEEFMCRALAINLRIGIVDEYLTIKRNVAAETPQSAARVIAPALKKDLSMKWNSDLELCRSNLLGIESASFALAHREDYRRISMHPLSVNDTTLTTYVSQPGMLLDPLVNGKH